MAQPMFRPFEPKTKNRFVFYIDGIPSYIIKATNLPELDNGEIKVHYLNSSFKVKGMSEWSDIELTLYDPIDENGASKVRNWVIQHHLSTFGLDGYAFGFNLIENLGGNISGPLGNVLGDLQSGQVPGGAFDSPLGYKKNIEIRYLAPNPENEYQNWVIFGAYIKKSNWGDLDWSAGEAIEMRLLLGYDYAELL